ncbi:MAG: hypothetical protein GTO02_13580 [Candidatus Dadabacteria bacterium]|nr:hypothetical protein [Candidatus Dadabacteria bacterium]
MNQKETLIIDGIKLEVKPPDLDRDGKSGGVEKIQSKYSNVQVPKESTELGEAITEFNKDDVSPDRLSSIDFRSRIDPYEIGPMIALDALIGMGCLPVQCGILNRVKMRKSVSLKGLGRKEFVDVVTGKRDFDQNSLKKGMSNMMGGGKER